MVGLRGTYRSQRGGRLSPFASFFMLSGSSPPSTEFLTMGLIVFLLVHGISFPAVWRSAWIRTGSPILLSFSSTSYSSISRSESPTLLLGTVCWENRVFEQFTQMHSTRRLFRVDLSTTDIPTLATVLACSRSFLACWLLTKARSRALAVSGFASTALLAALMTSTNARFPLKFQAWRNLSPAAAVSPTGHPSERLPIVASTQMDGSSGRNSRRWYR